MDDPKAIFSRGDFCLVVETTSNPKWDFPISE